MLSASQLDAMRTQCEDDFDTTCTIRRFTSAPDGAGGTTETWSNAATSVPCRERSASPEEREVIAGGGIRAISNRKVLFEWDRDVRPGDELIMASGELRSVIDTDKGKSDNLQIVAWCKRIQELSE